MGDWVVGDGGADLRWQCSCVRVSLFLFLTTASAGWESTPSPPTPPSPFLYSLYLIVVYVHTHIILRHCTYFCSTVIFVAHWCLLSFTSPITFTPFTYLLTTSIHVPPSPKHSPYLLTYSPHRFIFHLSHNLYSTNLLTHHTHFSLPQPALPTALHSRPKQ